MIWKATFIRGHQHISKFPWNLFSQFCIQSRIFTPLFCTALLQFKWCLRSFVHPQLMLKSWLGHSNWHSCCRFPAIPEIIDLLHGPSFSQQTDGFTFVSRALWHTGEFMVDLVTTRSPDPVHQQQGWGIFADLLCLSFCQMWHCAFWHLNLLEALRLPVQPALSLIHQLLFSPAVQL